MPATESNYITEVRALNKQVWDGINGLVAKQRQYNALDYGSTLPDGGDSDATKQGNNAGITRAEVGAVVFDTANAIVAVLNTGHATNMAKLL